MKLDIPIKEQLLLNAYFRTNRRSLELWQDKNRMAKEKVSLISKVFNEDVGMHDGHPFVFLKAEFPEIEESFVKRFPVVITNELSCMVKLPDFVLSDDPSDYDEPVSKIMYRNVWVNIDLEIFELDCDDNDVTPGDYLNFLYMDDQGLHDLVHPHISSGTPCLEGFVPMIMEAVGEYDFEALIYVLIAFLHEFNHLSSYWNIKTVVKRLPTGYQANETTIAYQIACRSMYIGVMKSISSEINRANTMYDGPKNCWSDGYLENVSEYIFTAIFHVHNRMFPIMRPALTFMIENLNDIGNIDSKLYKSIMDKVFSLIPFDLIKPIIRGLIRPRQYYCNGAIITNIDYEMDVASRFVQLLSSLDAYLTTILIEEIDLLLSSMLKSSGKVNKIRVNFMIFLYSYKATIYQEKMHLDVELYDKYRKQIRTSGKAYYIKGEIHHVCQHFDKYNKMSHELASDVKAFLDEKQRNLDENKQILSELSPIRVVNEDSQEDDS